MSWINNIQEQWFSVKSRDTEDEKEDDRTVTKASMTSQTLSDVENDIYLQIDNLQWFQISVKDCHICIYLYTLLLSPK